MADDDKKDYAKLEIPEQPRDPKNIEAKKYYIFNETGNIMMATTDEDSSVIQQPVREPWP